MSKMPVQSTSNHQLLASKVARVFGRFGWKQPAAIVLEAGWPLIFIVAQLFYVAQPALSLFWSYQRLTQVGQFLEDPEAMQHLLELLEVE